MDQGEAILPHQIPNYLLCYLKNLLEHRRNQPRPFNVARLIGRSFEEELRHLDDEITEKEVF